MTLTTAPPDFPTSALTVFCGSALGNSPAFVAATNQLGAALARHGIMCVYGGGGSGLMGTIKNATLRAGGRVHGVIPTAFLARGERPRSAEIPPEISEDGIPEVVDAASGEALKGWRHVQTPTGGMHSRKRLMAKLCDGFLVLPGGLGTLEELAEMCTWTQLGIHKKPVVLLNINGFFNGLRSWIDSSIEAGFISPENRALLTFLDKPAGASEEWDWGEAALAAVEAWKAAGAGGGNPYNLVWEDDDAKLGEEQS